MTPPQKTPTHERAGRGRARRPSLSGTSRRAVRLQEEPPEEERADLLKDTSQDREWRGCSFLSQRHPGGAHHSRPRARVRHLLNMGVGYSWPGRPGGAPPREPTAERPHASSHTIPTQFRPPPPPNPENGARHPPFSGNDSLAGAPRGGGCLAQRRIAHPVHPPAQPLIVPLGRRGPDFWTEAPLRRSPPSTVEGCAW